MCLHHHQGAVDTVEWLLQLTSRSIFSTPWHSRHPNRAGVDIDRVDRCMEISGGVINDRANVILSAELAQKVLSSWCSWLITRAFDVTLGGRGTRNFLVYRVHLPALLCFCTGTFSLRFPTAFERARLATT